MTRNVRLLRVSTHVLAQALGLPETTEITSVCVDPMTIGEILLRIEDPSFLPLDQGWAIPKCSAHFEREEVPVADGPGAVMVRTVFKGYK